MHRRSDDDECEGQDGEQPDVRREPVDGAGAGEIGRAAAPACLAATSVGPVGLHSALAAAVDDNLIAVNPAANAKPPTAKEAKSPEMGPGTPTSCAPSWTGPSESARSCTRRGCCWP